MLLLTVRSVKIMLAKVKKMAEIESQIDTVDHWDDSSHVKEYELSQKIQNGQREGIIKRIMEEPAAVWSEDPEVVEVIAAHIKEYLAGGEEEDKPEDLIRAAWVLLGAAPIRPNLPSDSEQL